MNSYNEVRQALDPVVGVPFADLAPVLGFKFVNDAQRRKAIGGDIVETILEIAKNSIPRPDLESLGTEVKTISLNTLSRPRDWTKIHAFNRERTASEPRFRYSSVYDKLRSILFVPVMKADKTRPDFWYFRPPFLWLPTEDQLTRMEEDYGIIQKAAAASDWSRLSGGPGNDLTLNTSDDKTATKGPDKKRRAWFLKGNLTREICRQHLWPREAMQQRRDFLLPRDQSN